MKLEYIIKNIVQNNKVKTQNELTEILLNKGINTTQSNISRILKKLNTANFLVPFQIQVVFLNRIL